MLSGSSGRKSEDGTNWGAEAPNRDLCDVRDVSNVTEDSLTDKFAVLKKRHHIVSKLLRTLAI
jgi:hypothetical protein